MNWIDLLKNIFEAAIIPLFGVLTAALIKFIQTKNIELHEKTDNEILEKYSNMLTQTITDCVVATNQTYVSSLKEIGEFDVAAQKEAFSKTYNAVLSILSEESKQYFENIYGDLSIYLTNKIEQIVNYNKD